MWLFSELRLTPLPKAKAAAMRPHLCPAPGAGPLCLYVLPSLSLPPESRFLPPSPIAAQRLGGAISPWGQHQGVCLGGAASTREDDDRAGQVWVYTKCVLGECGRPWNLLHAPRGPRVGELCSAGRGAPSPVPCRRVRAEVGDHW